jgi:hypothetical protein
MLDMALSICARNSVRFVEHRVDDPRIINLIQKWLKAGRRPPSSLPSKAAGTPPSFGRCSRRPWRRSVRLGRVADGEMGCGLGAVKLELIVFETYFPYFG